MSFSQDKTTTAINLHFGSPKVYLASSLLFEVAEFGAKLGAQAGESMILMSERMGGNTDLTQGYTVAVDVGPVTVQPKRMMLYLNVDAPLVFAPSRTEEKKGPTIVIDLGRVVVEHDSGLYAEVVPDFMNYKIDMTDLNAFITEGDSSDPKAYEDGAIIKKFGMHFNVGVRSAEKPDLPATKLLGHLPEINVFVTKEKLRDILIVTSSIIPPETLAAGEAQSTKQTTVAAPTTAHKKEFVLDAFFSIERFNLILRDTTEGIATTRRGNPLARISFTRLETKFVMTNEKMDLDVKLNRFSVKDRLNKDSAISKNLITSPKGKSVEINSN